MTLEEDIPILREYDNEYVKVPITEHLFKYLGLLFICLVPLGGYFIYDDPGAFGDEVISSWYRVDELKYGVLYSVYSFPNIIMVLIGGYLMDSVLGLRKSLILFCFLVTVGQILFAISANLRLFWLAVLGRVVYGLGAETLYIITFSYVTVWFIGRKDFSLAFAISNTVGRIAGATNLNVTAKIAAKTSIPFAIWFGAFICVGSFVCSLGLAFLETIRMKKEKKEQLLSGGVEPEDQVVEFKLSDIKNFPLSYWLVIGLIVCFFIPIFVFITFAKDLFISYFPEINPDNLISLPYYVACVAPAIGFLVDRFGRNVYFLGVGGILQLLAFILIGYTQVSPFACVILLGLCMAIMLSAAMVLISSLIPTKIVGIAFGIASSILNGSIALGNIIINSLLQSFDNNYMIPINIFIGLSCIAVGISSALVFIDRNIGSINGSAKKMQENVKKLNMDKDPLLIN